MRRIIPIVCVVALGIAACGAANERLTEEIIEQAGGGDADVDLDLESGEVSVETDEGSFTIGGGEIPDGFPVPFPDGGTVQSVLESGGSAGVSVAYPGERLDELVSYYDDWVAGQPGEWQSSEFSTDLGDGTFNRGKSWYGESTNLSVTTCYAVGSDALDSACVNANVEG